MSEPLKAEPRCPESPVNEEVLKCQIIGTPLTMMRFVGLSAVVSLWGGGGGGVFSAGCRRRSQAHRCCTTADPRHAGTSVGLYPRGGEKEGNVRDRHSFVLEGAVCPFFVDRRLRVQDYKKDSPLRHGGTEHKNPLKCTEAHGRLSLLRSLSCVQK